MAGKFELKKGKTGKFSFNLKAGNGQVVFTSQTYADKRSATAGIKSVKKNAQNAARIERKESTKKQPYFVITAPNGQVIGKSQMYANAVSLEKGIKSVTTNAPGAPVDDLTKAPAKAKKKAPAKKKAKAKVKKAKTKAKKAATKTKTKAKKAATKTKAKAKKAATKTKAKAKKAKTKVKKKAKTAVKKAKKTAAKAKSAVTSS